MTALQVALEFAVLVFLGIFIVRIRLVGPDFRSQLAKYVTNVALPCMIARSLYAQTERFHGVGLVLLLAVLTIAVLLAGGQAVYLLSGKGDLGKSARFSMAFGNFTFMGFPVVESLYGADGLFVFTLFTMPVRLLFYSSPGFLLRPGGASAQKPKGKELLKLFISPPIVAVFVGLILYALRLQPPLFLDKAVQALGSTASVLGMLLVGMGMAGMGLRTLWERRRALLIVLSKAILCPALMLLLFLFFPLDPEVKKPLFLYGAVPVPSLLTAFSFNQGRSEEACQDASAAVLLSTLLSVLTLPVWAAVGEHIFK
ncbi:MAG: AEC family transporter [Oscillospiraceae bacterium]|nr:AEC family transporter [Oscillospiraceae bacterium]